MTKTLYQSKTNAEKKLAQARLVLNEMQEYRGKVYVNEGRDPTTGAYPLQTKVGSFLSSARSALQYMHKECKEHRNTSLYDSSIIKHPIIRQFRVMRDFEIHECPIGVQTVISLESPLHLVINPQDDEFRVDDSKTRDAKVRQRLLAPLADTANHYEVVEHDGEDDLYILFEQYLLAIRNVMEELAALGAVT
jgi:hypothetical protein